MTSLTKMTLTNAPIGKKLIAVVFHKVDNTVRRVELKFEGDTMIEARSEYDHTDVKLAVPKPPEMKEMWRVSGTHTEWDTRVSKMFDREGDAKDHLDGLGNSYMDMKVEKVKVALDDAGEPVSDEIPF